MGNCLKRSGSGHQDNTTLLSNNTDPPTLTSGSLQEGLGPPIPNNVISFLPIFRPTVIPLSEWCLSLH